MNHKDYVEILFLLVLLFLCYLLYQWQKDNTDFKDFNLTDLLMENGKLSKMAVTWMGSFTVMSFGFIHMVVNEKLTDTYAGLYAATWAVPILTKMFAPKPSGDTSAKS